MTGTYRIWPLGKPIPRGWHFSEPLPGHHGNYSIIIKRDFWRAVVETLRSIF